MFPIANRIRAFLRRTDGAVTVDYVMLAAICTVMGLGSAAVVTDGFAGLAGVVDGELKGEPIEELAGLTYSDGFDNGAGGWSGAGTTDLKGLGSVLGPIPRSGGAPSVTRDFRIDPNAKQAQFEFDMLTLDDLENEGGVVYIDGAEVGRVMQDKGVATFTAAAGLAERGLIVRGEIVDQNADLGGKSGSKDSRTSIRITVGNPGEVVSFGIGSTANQGKGNESVAIDNFIARGLRAEGGGAGTT